MRFLIASLLFIASLTSYAEGNAPDTVRKTLHNLSNIGSFDEIYPYSPDDPNFYYFEFKQFDVAFYDCGYAFYTHSYKGNYPKAFFDLLNNNPEHKEIKLGSKLVFHRIILQNDKYLMKGKPFVVLIVDTEPEDEYGGDDDWNDDSWDDYEDDYNYEDDYDYGEDDYDYGDDDWEEEEDWEEDPQR